MSIKIPDFTEAGRAAAADVRVRRLGGSIAVESATGGRSLDRTSGFAPGMPPGSAP